MLGPRENAVSTESVIMKLMSLPLDLNSRRVPLLACPAVLSVGTGLTLFQQPVTHLAELGQAGLDRHTVVQKPPST